MDILVRYVWMLSFILNFSHPDVFQKNKLYLNSRILPWKAQLWETFWENKDYLCVNLPCIHEMKQEQSLFLLSSLKFWLTLFISTTVVLPYTQIEAVSGMEARTRNNSYTTLCISASANNPASLLSVLFLWMPPPSPTACLLFIPVLGHQKRESFTQAWSAVM